MCCPLLIIATINQDSTPIAVSAEGEAAFVITHGWSRSGDVRLGRGGSSRDSGLGCGGGSGTELWFEASGLLLGGGDLDRMQGSCLRASRIRWRRGMGLIWIFGWLGLWDSLGFGYGEGFWVNEKEMIEGKVGRRFFSSFVW